MSQQDPPACLPAAPIFIVGMPRSGTTWVYDILTAHPQVAGVSESYLFSQRNGLGALFSPLHFPRRIIGIGSLLSRAELLVEVRDFAERLLARAVGPGQHYLVEKSPAHLHVMPLIAEIFPDARFIHVLRDGRDVAVSIRCAARSWAPQWGRTGRASVLCSALRWRRAANRVRRETAPIRDRFLDIRYESIRTDPLEGIRTLFDFSNIPLDDALLHEIHRRTDFDRHYPAGDAGFRRGGRIGDWRSYFNWLDALTFNLAAGKMLVEHGYEHRRFWSAPLFRKHRAPRRTPRASD